MAPATLASTWIGQSATGAFHGGGRGGGGVRYLRHGSFMGETKVMYVVAETVGGKSVMWVGQGVGGGGGGGSCRFHGEKLAE